jgi:hypothetical protein
MVVDRCCSRPSSHLAQVRVPIGSAWAATDAIRVSEIVTGSVALMASSSSALFPIQQRAAPPQLTDSTSTGEQALGLHESSAPTHVRRGVARKSFI